MEDTNMVFFLNGGVYVCFFVVLGRRDRKKPINQQIN